MADFAERSAENTPGRFYVDSQCLDCDLCREVAPAHFRRNDEGGFSYVFRQPVSPQEVAACEEVVQGCPVEAVGSDGDGHSWSEPTAREQESVRHANANIVYPEKLFPFLTVSRDLPAVVSRVLRRVLGRGPHA